MTPQVDKWLRKNIGARLFVYWWETETLCRVELSEDLYVQGEGSGATPEEACADACNDLMRDKEALHS